LDASNKLLTAFTPAPSLCLCACLFCSQKFRLVIAADTSRLDGITVAPAYSNPIMVLSKRKDRKRKAEAAAAAAGETVNQPPRKCSYINVSKQGAAYAQQLALQQQQQMQQQLQLQADDVPEWYRTRDNEQQQRPVSPYASTDASMLARAADMLLEAEWTVIGFSLNAATGKADSEMPIERCFRCRAVHMGGKGFPRLHAPGCELRALLDEYSVLGPNGASMHGGAHGHGAFGGGGNSSAGGPNDSDDDDDDNNSNSGDEERASNRFAGSSADGNKASSGGSSGGGGGGAVGSNNSMAAPQPVNKRTWRGDGALQIQHLVSSAMGGASAGGASGGVPGAITTAADGSAVAAGGTRNPAYAEGLRALMHAASSGNPPPAGTTGGVPGVTTVTTGTSTVATNTPMGGAPTAGGTGGSGGIANGAAGMGDPANAAAAASANAQAFHNNNMMNSNNNMMNNSNPNNNSNNGLQAAGVPQGGVQQGLAPPVGMQRCVSDDGTGFFSAEGSVILPEIMDQRAFAALSASDRQLSFTLHAGGS
jgi:hypothetical protein